MYARGLKEFLTNDFVQLMMLWTTWHRLGTDCKRNERAPVVQIFPIRIDSTLKKKIKMKMIKLIPLKANLEALKLETLEFSQN